MRAVGTMKGDVCVVGTLRGTPRGTLKGHVRAVGMMKGDVCGGVTEGTYGSCGPPRGNTEGTLREHLRAVGTIKGDVCSVVSLWDTLWRH